MHITPISKQTLLIICDLLLFGCFTLSGDKLRMSCMGNQHYCKINAIKHILYPLPTFICDILHVQVAYGSLTNLIIH